MPEPLKSIAEEWDLFASYVVRPGFPPEQVADMKRCFYAGATTILKRSLIMPDDEEAALKIMSGWNNEVDQFFAAMVGEAIANDFLKKAAS